MKLIHSLLTLTLLCPMVGSPAGAQQKPPAKNTVGDLQKVMERVDGQDATARPVLRTYRLTYTVTESDGGKKLGVQHFSMVLDSSNNGRGQIKLGSRVPVPVTGDKGAQVTYLDVGLNISATIATHPSGDSVLTMLDQSSLIDSPAGGSANPLIRQTSLSAGIAIPFTRPVLIGSLDTPGSTRHLDVEVAMELVP